jgi:hypothetical protein
MKDAGHLPKNLQFSPPNIYGEQMGSVQQSAGAKLKQVGQELLDEMITNITQQRDAARDKAAALRQGDAATAVKAAYPGLPDAWGGPFCQNMFNQVQSSILMELDLKLAAAYDAMTAAAQRKQQQAQEKAATPAAGAQHQPRKQRAQQQQPAQGQPRPAGRGGRPQQPAQKPQQQQQQQQRPHKRRQGPAPGGAPTYADAARGGPKPVNDGQRPRPQQQGPRF